MKCVLRYGTSGAVEFDLAPEALVAECRGPRGEPLADVAAATGEILLHPLNFPSLGQAVVPGDKVTLAVGADVPQRDLVLKAIAAHLTEHGVSLSDIAVLCLSDAAAQDLEPSPSAAPSHVDASTGLTMHLHRPAVRGELAYLSADDAGESILLNRLLCDADVVVPVGCFRPEFADAATLDATLFPAFADAKSQARQPLAVAIAGGTQSETPPAPSVPEVAWKLGIQFTVQVIPAAGDGVLHVLGGDPEAVFARGRELCRQAWSFDVPRQASLAIAAIEGDASQQTWANVGRAAEVAANCVADGGAVVICCDLASPPSDGVQMLARDEDRGRTLKRLKKERPSDAVTAAQLVNAAETAKLYLFSRLDESTVEDLGVAAVSCPEDVARLAKRHASCILIHNAQHVAIELG